MTHKLDRPALVWAKACICALVTSFALSVQVAMPGSYGTLALPDRVGQLVQGTGVIYLVLFGALALYYRRLLPLVRPVLPSAALVSLFFALCLLFGQSFEATDSWAPVLGSPLRAALSLVMTAGYVLFFLPPVSALFRRLDRQIQAGAPVVPARGAQLRFFFLCLGLILLFWLPYLLLCIMCLIMVFYLLDRLFGLERYVSQLEHTFVQLQPNFQQLQQNFQQLQQFQLNNMNNNIH